MTNAQLIGKETMLARLVVFHTARFNRNGMSWKKDEYITYLKSLSTRKLSKEYDEAFASSPDFGSNVEMESTYAEFSGTMLPDYNIQYSSALMG